MSGERIELVQSFDELRAGMLVVLRDCAKCGGVHRAMLVTFGEFGTQYRGLPREGVAWAALPGACQQSVRVLVSPESVAERRVYRVIDDTDKAETTETETPRKIAEFMVHPSGLVVEWKE